VHRVAVLGVVDRQQRGVVRQVADPAVLGVPVELDRRVGAGAQQVQGGAVLVGERPTTTVPSRPSANPAS
jgi:hypothetical protein